MSIYLSVCVSICLSVCLSVCLPACLAGWLSVYLPTYLPTYLPIYLSIYLSIWGASFFPDSEGYWGFWCSYFKYRACVRIVCSLFAAAAGSLEHGAWAPVPLQGAPTGCSCRVPLQSATAGRRDGQSCFGAALVPPQTAAHNKSCTISSLCCCNLTHPSTEALVLWSSKLADCCFAAAASKVRPTRSAR